MKNHARPKANRWRRGRVFTVFLLVLGGIGVGWWLLSTSIERTAGRPDLDRLARYPVSLNALLALPETDLAQCDIAVMNLLCTEGLPGTDNLNRETLLAQLDAWASRIRSETERHSYRFRANAAEFEHSEAFFRLLMMTVVVQEDFKVRYNPARATASGADSAIDDFFQNSRDIFLHGLLSGERTGTCSSMPVLYAALGRRLGYPLKLVTTKGHLFVRWESATERVNAEITNTGINRFDDNYYKQWPFEVTDDEVRAEGYLKSLNAREELAVFLSTRGLCLMEAGRRSEAAESFAHAAKLAPSVASYKLMTAQLQIGSGIQSSVAVQ